jgi:hypothetical protein
MIDIFQTKIIDFFQNNEYFKQHIKGIYSTNPKKSFYPYAVINSILPRSSKFVGTIEAQINIDIFLGQKNLNTCLNLLGYFYDEESFLELKIADNAFIELHDSKITRCKQDLWVLRLIFNGTSVAQKLQQVGKKMED